MAKLTAAACLGALCWLVATVINGVVTPFYLDSQHVSTSLADWIVVRSVLLNLGLVIMVGYALVLAVTGIVLTRRRDVT